MSHSHSLPKNRLLPLTALGLALLAGACAATSVKKTWKAPGAQRPAGKIAVLAIDDRGLVRQGFENRFAKQLTAAGSSAFPTFDLLSYDAIKQDKPAAAENLRARGAAALLIVRLAGVAGSHQDPQGRTAATLSGLEFMGWYDFYAFGFRSLNSPYADLKEKAYLEMGLYDLATEKCLWAGLSETVVKENADRVAEMDPLVAKVIAAMRKDGVVP